MTTIDVESAVWPALYFYLREGKVRIIVELARKISERAREREKLAKRVSHRFIGNALKYGK